MKADFQAIADIEQRLARAWVDRDRAAIDAILAADWSVIDSAGRVLTAVASHGSTVAQ